ncbi:methylmalonyl Co-A mutase-associated GTPase MeaB [Haladaptatus sp. GCM10025707]|uniref:methylmalonyl Co-A mutase-associated GTPase MeaB n=1 Tax=unclassified Haladaptatus TaxID=2622732 RepID=UPI0023E79B43|nr:MULTISPECIES: methylmalonyl Co-A mutase-associated GTPase MeaB [unclassified Haladaptatus]
MSATASLVDDLLAGKHRALARTITKIENRSPGYRELVSQLHAHTGDAEVVGVTGSPGAGKSTLVDQMAKVYRDQGFTVGVIAVDPSSPYTGGAVLGDRIRMASTVGDMDVFFRSMSARGSLGGLSTATADAVKALDAFGKDKIIIETVGAGQNEIDIVRTADTVAVLVPPASGDDIQMLKAGILEIGDVFVVNKADLDGADRTVQELKEMIHMRDSDDDWEPLVVETIAKSGEGIAEFLDALSEHYAYLEDSGRLEEKARTRYAEEIRALLRADIGSLISEEVEDQGGIEALVDEVVAREADPYTIADRIMEPLEDCVSERRQS